MVTPSVLLLLVVTSLYYEVVSGQQASYGAPTGGSASFSNPDTGYGAPEDSYSSAQGYYDYDQAYSPSQDDLGFDLGKIGDFIQNYRPAAHALEFPGIRYLGTGE